MLNQFAVEIPTLPVDQCHSQLIRFLEGCCDSLSYRRAAEKGRQSFGTQHGLSGNVFANPDASSSAPYPQELHQWNSSEEPLHSSTVEKSERPEQNQDLRCQSGPSATKIQSSSVEETLQRIMVQTNNDCRFRIFILKVPYASHVCLLEDEVQDRGLYMFTISYASDAMDQRSGVG